MTTPGNAAFARRVEGCVGSPVASATPVHGGDVGEAFDLRLRDGRRLFAKRVRGAPPELAAREAEGLAWLAAARALPVPELVAVEPEAGILVLEWIEPGPTPGREAHAAHTALGRGLAALHGAGADAFGGPRDNFLGPLPQPNDPRPTWARFYAEQRLAPMVRRARDAGALDPADVRALDALGERMESRVGPPEPAARLHGDLWSGNVHWDRAGRAWLIDPAVYGGHREVDLAMLRLFGGVDAAAFAAYDEALPLAPGHAERVPLYQLYPLLVHVVLFGRSYLGRLRSALAAVS